MPRTAFFSQSAIRFFLIFILAGLFLAGIEALLIVPALATAPASPDLQSNDLTLTTQDGLSLTFSADGHVIGLSVGGDDMPITPGPALWLRDMSNAGQVETPNLLTNAGFESGRSGWQIINESGVAVTLTDEVSHRGAHALQIEGVSSQKKLNGGVVASVQSIPVTPGQRYRLAGYFLSSQGYVQGVSGTPPLRQDQMWRGLMRPNGLYVRWLDAANAPIGQPALVAPLHWNAHAWRRISGEVRAPAGAARMSVIIVGRVEEDTLWVDDLSLIASPEAEQPITGNIYREEEKLIQTAHLDSGLLVTATYTAHEDFIDVHVELTDLAGQDRALEVVWGLPLRLAQASALSPGASWRWWDDVRHSRPIHPGQVAPPPTEHPLPESLSWVYEHVVSGVWDGWLPVSLYPYALVENGVHGLALATSLASPRLVKLSYDQEQGRFEARHYLGISNAAPQLHHSADFDLELYQVTPEWGLRAAMDRYARRHSEWFNSPRPLYGYNGYERGSYGTPQKANEVKENDEKGIFTAEYIVADAVLDIAKSSEPRPSYDDTIARVEALAGSSSPFERAQSRAITQSVAYSANDDWQIKHIDEFEWARGRWQAVWCTSVDPDIEDGWGPLQWDWRINRAITATEAITAVLDGVMMDNFLSAPGVDLNPAHLTTTQTAMTYDIATYRPGIHNMANIYEYFEWLRQRLQQRGRDDMAITINFWGIATPNSLAPLIDGFGGEGRSKSKPDVNWNPRILDYRRAIAYHKVLSWTNGESDLTRDDVKAYTARALFYGIYPTRKDEARNWEQGADAILQKAQHVWKQYAGAGWEPLTYARTDEQDVWIERFGRVQMGPMQSGLYFTLYNRTDAMRSTTVTLEAADLGIIEPGAVTLTDIITGETIPFRASGDIIRFQLTLGPQQTHVVQVTAAQEPVVK